MCNDLVLVAARYGFDWRFATANGVAAFLGGVVCADGVVAAAPGRLAVLDGGWRAERVGAGARWAVELTC